MASPGVSPPADRGALARRAGLWCALGVALLAGAAYLPSARYGFVWDDHFLVEPHPALSSAAGVARALTTDLYGGSDPSLPASDYYRPVAVATWWANARLLGAGPGALHLGNVLLHAAAAALLVLLLRRRVPASSWVVAAVVAAWWALHPENVEPVAWISGRYDLLCGGLALALLLAPAAGARGAAARGLLVLAGLLSKEGFLAMIAVVAVDDWAARRPWRAVLPSWLSMTGAVAACVAARSAAGVRAPADGSLASPVHFLTAAGTYAARALAPLPLTTGHPYAPWPGIAAAAVGIALAGAAVLAWRRRELATPLALFAAPLAPVGMAAAGMGSLAERYFYVPALGLAWLLAAGLAAAARARPGARRGLVVVVGVVVALGAASALTRLPDWRSDRALFEAALRVDPDDWTANLNLGRADLAEGDLEAARRHLERAQAANPRSEQAANALAFVHLRTRDGAALVEQARRAVALDPRFPQARLNLAVGHHLTGDHRAERAQLDEALRLSPGWLAADVARATVRCETEPAPGCEADLERLARGGGAAATAALRALVEGALARGDAPAARDRLARLRAHDPRDAALLELERRAAALGAAPG